MASAANNPIVIGGSDSEVEWLPAPPPVRHRQQSLRARAAPPPRPGLHELPTEIVQEYLSYMEPDDANNAKATSRRFRDIVSHPNTARVVARNLAPFNMRRARWGEGDDDIGIGEETFNREAFIEANQRYHEVLGVACRKPKYWTMCAWIQDFPPFDGSLGHVGGPTWYLAVLRHFVDLYFAEPNLKPLFTMRRSLPAEMEEVNYREIVRIVRHIRMLKDHADPFARTFYETFVPRVPAQYAAILDHVIDVNAMALLFPRTDFADYLVRRQNFYNRAPPGPGDERECEWLSEPECVSAKDQCAVLPPQWNNVQRHYGLSNRALQIDESARCVDQYSLGHAITQARERARLEDNDVDEGIFGRGVNAPPDTALRRSLLLRLRAGLDAYW
jgi:hypothetical protein